MKKLILPIILLLTVAFFSPQKVNAQTDPECFREYQAKEYKCLQKFNDCTKTCTSLGSVEAYNPCANNCSAQDKTCSEQASADLTACKAAIPKNKEEIASEDKSAQDCRKIFDKESYKCLGVSGDCQRKCGEETKRPDGGAYFNSGEVYSKCTKASDCDGKGRACNEQALANFRACQDAGKQPAAAEAKKEVVTSKGFVGINFLETWSEFIRDPASIVKETEILTEKADVAEGPRINTSQLSIFRQPTEGVAWIDQSKMSDLWIKAKGQNEYQQVKNGLQTIEPGSYVKASEPTSIMVRGVGRVDLRPGPSGSALLAIEERNGAISPLLLLGEMEVAYSKPIIESTQKPVDWEQIKFVVRTPNSFVTVSRTHYLVKYDEKENKTTVAVYEGQVEVQSAGGKVLSITPDGDKPGVVIVSQKLSPIKLAIAGVVLAAVIGGVVLILKRKFAAKGSIKKRR